MPKPVQCVGSEDCLMISYTVWHQDKKLESCAPQEPVEYQMGSGQWPPQLELAMLGKGVGAHLNIHLKASDNAFGAPDPERIVSMEALDFENEPEPGDLIEFRLADGELLEGQVLVVFGDTIDIDFNHPYVGRNLTFEIDIHRIV